MTRQGFTLIELLVSLAISAMMATLLFQALSQANVAVDAGDNIMDLSTKTAQVQQLLERDLSGATTLVDNEPPHETDMVKTVTKTEGDKTTKKEETKEDTAPKEKQIIKKLFFSSTGPGGLGTLTFITNNPLMSFWSSFKGASDKGKPKPYLARVTYSVEEDKTSPGSFRLLRQESSVLDYEKKSGRTYEVVDSIKHIAVKFTAKTEKITPAKQEAPEKDNRSSAPTSGTQPKKAPAKKEKPKVEVTYNVVTTWDTDQLKEEEKKKTEQKTSKKDAPLSEKKEEPEEKKKLIPVQVSLEIAFLDKEKKAEKISKIDIGIITDTDFSLPQKPASFLSLFQQEPPVPEPGKQDQNKQQFPGQAPGGPGNQLTLFDRLNNLGERLSNLLNSDMNQNQRIRV